MYEQFNWNYILQIFLLFRFLNTKKTSSISWKIRSRTQKMTNWAYAQRPKNDPLSVHSMTQKMTLWAYAQWPKNDPLSIRSMTPKIALWAYAQWPKKLRGLVNSSIKKIRMEWRPHPTHSMDRHLIYTGGKTDSFVADLISVGLEIFYIFILIK